MTRSNFLFMNQHANLAKCNHLIFMNHHTYGITTITPVCSQEFMHTHTHRYIHIQTASGKDAGLDHECGLVDCITIVKCLWHNDLLRVYDRNTRSHTYTMGEDTTRAFAWVDGRWAMLSDDLNMHNIV